MTTYVVIPGGERCLRMSGRRGHGRRAEPWGRPVMHGFGFFGRGPRAGRGDVRAAILALLSEQPMHGYQIMRELAERSGGVWRASPGSVYPTLQQLQDEELVVADESSGGRRTFRLTEAGEAAAKEAAASGTTPWQAVADETGEQALELRDLVGGLLMAARQVVHAGTPEQVDEAKGILREARRRLYRILAQDDPEGGDADRGQTP